MFGKGVELTVESSEYQTKIDSCQQVTNARCKELLEKNQKHFQLFGLNINNQLRLNNQLLT